MSTETFQSEIEAFLSSTGMTPTRFGRKAMGDPSFVFDVREGRSVSLKVFQKVTAFMRDYKEHASQEGSAA